MYKILFITTPFGPELETVSVHGKINIIGKELETLGNKVSVIVPKNIVMKGLETISIEGKTQPLIQTYSKSYPIIKSGVLQKMLNKAYNIQKDYDVIINTCHHWLAYYVSNFFQTRVLHVPNVSRILPVIDEIIIETAKIRPNDIAFLSRAQAEDFGLHKNCRIVGNPIDINNYQLNLKPSKDLAFAGRISPEKGLEDTIKVAVGAGRKLRIMGNVQHQDYWQNLYMKYKDNIDYKGFLDKRSLQKELGDCSALIMTQKWKEAFGLVSIEAMACGTPVIAYDKGANKNLINNGKNGFLVDFEDISGAINCLDKIQKISRKDCRDFVAKNFDVKIIAKNYNNWLKETNI